VKYVLYFHISTFLLLLLLLLFVTPSMQGIYIYIPGINRVPTVYSVAAVLYLQFVPHVMLFPVLNMFYINTFRTTRMSVVPSVAVFCRSSMLCFPSMLLRYYCLNDSAMVPVTPVIAGITLFLYSTRIVFLL